uniref:Sushi domain-containing protein n=1 Tax=Strigamia maritima TaxID=126957 RepID=T1IKR5_STRMM
MLKHAPNMAQLKLNFFLFSLLLFFCHIAHHTANTSAKCAIKYLIAGRQRVATILQDTVNSGENILFECRSTNNQLSEHALLKCSNGKWQLPYANTKCRSRKSCLVRHPSFPNGILPFNPIKSNANEYFEINRINYLKLICKNKKHDLFINGKLHDSKLSCYDDVLTGRTIECKKKCNCSLLNLPESIELEEKCDSSVTSDISLELMCAPNFTDFSGNDRITCRDGEWFADVNVGYCHAHCSSPDIPHSIISTIPNAPSPKILRTNHIHHMYEILIQCQNGYYLENNENENVTLRCYDGQYDKIIPKCIQSTVNLYNFKLQF